MFCLNICTWVFVLIEICMILSDSILTMFIMAKVLKERGVDNIVNSHDEAQGPSRIKNDTHRAEVAPGHAIASRQGESNHLNDQRTGRGHEKRGQRADMQRKNWRNDNWRSGRDTEKHHQERQPSPESWRKPIEQPTDNSGLRFGKAVSAVDLAQAFSKPISSPKPVDQFSGQRGVPTKKGLPARSQVPFSRLAETTTRPQINGY
ncbi:Translation initiation factor IF-2 [Bienertia sinuspersici]